MKKFLSLVLALAMALSLVTVSAGAKDFTDSDDLSGEAYEEAVNVMSEMEIIDGYADGDFRPQGTLTRQAAAKIIACMILGKTTAESLGTSAAPFKDVPAGSSFAGYIAFCVERGLISGYADGTFRPTGTLTGFAFLKMLLGALGYDQSIEGYTGTNWTVNVAGRAYEIGLTDGNDEFVGSQPCTREEAALYAVNTLKATLVEYENKGSSITVNGAEIVTGASAPTYVTSSVYNQATSINADRDNSGDYTVEFAERYQPDLRLDAETDVFGRPARVWSWDGEEIGTYVDYSLMVAEYTTSVTGKELYNVVGKTAHDKYDFYAYVDGEDDDLYKEIARNNESDVDHTDNGALTQVFVDSEAEEVIVTVVNTYLAQAIADYNEKKDTVDFEVYGVTSKETVSGEDFNVSDVAKDDFVLVTYADNDIQSIDDVEILSEVEINRFSANGNHVTAVTVDGTKYDASAMLDYDEEVLDDYTDTNLKDTTYNVYLDAYGYVIGVDIVDAADNYVFITGTDKGSSNLSTKNIEANAIFMDGTTAVIDVKNDGTVGDGALINSWFKYTVNSSDVYTLKEITKTVDIFSDDDYDVAQFRSTDAQVDKIDDRHIALKAINGKNVYGTDDTVYLLAELDKVSNTDGTYGVIKGVDEVVVGIDNAEFSVWNWEAVYKEVDMTYGTGNDISNGVYTLYDDNGDVIAAVVVGESGSVSESIAYAHTGDLEDESYDRSTEMWTWTRYVIINGEEVLLTETNDEDDSVLENAPAGKMAQWTWFVVKYDANGNVKDVEPYATEEAATYATSLNQAVTMLEDEDTVVANIYAGDDVYDLKGKTLYNVSDDEEGFRIAEGVKVVLRQQNNNKWRTTFDEGVDALEAVLDTLNEDPDHEYTLGAVIENGRATSVIVIDHSEDDDYKGPDGQPVGDVARVVLKKDGSIALYDKKGVAIAGTEASWTLYMRGPNQDEFREAASGSDISKDYTDVDAFMGARNDYSFYLVVDGVESSIVTTDPA